MSAHNERLDAILELADLLHWTKSETRNAITVHALPPFTGVSIMVPKPGGRGTLTEDQTKNAITKMFKYSDRDLVTKTLDDFHGKSRKSAVLAIMATMPAPDYAPSREAERTVNPEVIDHNDPVGAPTPHVVDEHPWLARHAATTRGGRKYASHAVTERIWSDGKTDYACTACDYLNDDPIAVATHYGRKRDAAHEHQDAHPLPTQLQVTDPNYVAGPVSREARVQRLRARILEAMNEFDTSTALTHPARFSEELAERLTPAGNDDTSGDTSTPLTAEQVLDRIRRLVDRGEYVRTQEQLCETTRRLAEVEERLLTVESERDDVRSRWQALRELIDNEG